MRYYHVGDDIYLFGFSRGAYTARFLAEMLDHVGLLSAGNEEMSRFAWKTFQKWQCRQEWTARERAEKKYLLDFMLAFRETFSRPVRRIRFLGLFDTVNSVPQFETAFLQRSKFPYTARSTAKDIRHAVAIDERRAKFRSDLISEQKRSRRRQHYYRKYLGLKEEEKELEQDLQSVKGGKDFRGRSRSTPGDLGRKTSLNNGRNLSIPHKQKNTYRNSSEVSGVRSLSPGMALSAASRDHSSEGADSLASERAINMDHYHDDSDDEEEQDIQGKCPFGA